MYANNTSGWNNLQQLITGEAKDLHTLVYSKY